MRRIEEAKRRIKKCFENQETDLSLIGLELTDLEKELPMLRDCEHLKQLVLFGNKISNLSSLTKLTNLVNLDLSGNQIIDISPITHLSKLTDLRLSGNQIIDISPLTNLTKLTDLVLSNNQINNIKPLRLLTKLKRLILHNNQIEETFVLSFLTNLTEIRLDDNPIRKLPNLSNSTNLLSLTLINTNISDFRPLLQNPSYKRRNRIVTAFNNPIPSELDRAIYNGYASLKTYYDTLETEGTIQNDQLKVILLGNSTAGKTSLLNYWGKKEFKEKQTTTHGIYTPMELPLKYEAEEGTFRVNVWDFGGQDYYHATHRLFVTRDSTYILVCNQNLENKPEQELTTEYFEEDDEIKELQVKVQHYHYRYWLQTLAFLTKSGRIDDKQNQQLDKTNHAKLFLVENKCGTYEHNQVMRLNTELSKTLPFEVINQDFFQLDIKEAWRYTHLKENDRKARKYAGNYEEFEEKLIEVLQAQIKGNRYEVHKNYPVIRDILASMAMYKQDTVVPDELNQILIDSKIAPIESYEKLPVWITYSQYEEIVRKNSLSEEPHFESLHIYLQNLCGRIFHFKDIPALADIVFIDPNWLHQTIYKVLSQEVLNKNGEFTLDEADIVIDGNILEAAKFMEVMMAFDLVFEIPYRLPRRFITPQYLPNDCPLSPQQVKKYQENYHELSLILEFPHYLPPSLISRIISQKGHFIKDGQEPLWRNGLIYTENGISIFILCQPTECKIEIYVGKGTQKWQIEQVLREFMEMLEQKFSDDIEDVLIELPNVIGKVKWEQLYQAKKDGGNKVENHEFEKNLINVKPFLFLIQEFDKKPINIFICYSHEDDKEMLAFLEPLKKELKSFEKQHGIRINPFSDLELKSGMLWDEVLQSNIDKNDILICLLSPTFFSSTYIQEKEYGKMKKIAESKPNVLIAPIYVKSCYIAEDNQIANLQFYKPSATSFNLSKDNKQFSFSNLMHHDNGSYINNYVTGFVESIQGKILGIWEGKHGVNTPNFDNI